MGVISQDWDYSETNIFFLLWPDLIEILSTCKVQVGCMNDQTCKNLESTANNVITSFDDEGDMVKFDL